MFMQIWDYQILILKISLKFVKLWGKHGSLVKPYIDTQYSTNSNMDFSIKWSQSEVNMVTFLILIQQLISNQNNIKWLIKQFN